MVPLGPYIISLDLSYFSDVEESHAPVGRGGERERRGRWARETVGRRWWVGRGQGRKGIEGRGATVGRG